MKAFVQTIVIFVTLFAFQIQSSVSQEKKFENAPKVVPNTTGEMQTPEFWISNTKGDVDRVMLSPEKIAELNTETRHLREKIKKLKDINGDSYNIDRTIRSNDTVGSQYKIEDPLP